MYVHILTATSGPSSTATRHEDDDTQRKYSTTLKQNNHNVIPHSRHEAEEKPETLPNKALFKHATQAVAASVTIPQNPGCPVEATAEQIRQKGLHTKF